MSLQVWLPLNGDLHNQGLISLPDTSVNTFSYSNGKIGQCATGRVAWHLDDEILGNTWSVAMWVKPESLGANNNILFCKNGTSSTDCHIYFSIISTTQLNLGVNGPSSSVTATGQTFTTGTWYHVAATYDGTTATIYLNGVELKHGTVTTACPTGRLNMNINGRSTNTANTGSTGSITCSFNDFRLYDNCLSAAEVKEIAQGLVLHYKLSTNNLINKSTLTANNYINASGGLTGTTGWFASDYIPITPGCVYQTFDLSHGGSNTRIAFYDINKTYKRNITIVANENLTLTAAEEEAYMRVSIRNLANELQIASIVEVPSIIEDSSGYNYNGTITGTITVENNSPRYSISSYFSGSSYILTPTGSFAWNDLTQLTFAAWMKPTASMTGWRGSVGIAADTSQVARGIAITDYGNEFRGTYTNGSTYVTIATGKTLTQNEWHHCAGTLNGTEFKLYFDGELVKTQPINWGTATLNTGARFEVGVDLPGSDEKFTGNYSDIRCYCTALTADDILQLYHTSAKVDNKQNLHAFELVESSSAIKINKRGQTLCNELEENTATKFYKTNQIIETNEIIEF